MKWVELKEEARELDAAWARIPVSLSPAIDPATSVSASSHVPPPAKRGRSSPPGSPVSVPRDMSPVQDRPAASPTEGSPAHDPLSPRPQPLSPALALWTPPEPSSHCPEAARAAERRAAAQPKGTMSDWRRSRRRRQVW